MLVHSLSRSVLGIGAGVGFGQDSWEILWVGIGGCRCMCERVEMGLGGGVVGRWLWLRWVGGWRGWSLGVWLVDRSIGVGVVVDEVVV